MIPVLRCLFLCLLALPAPAQAKPWSAQGPLHGPPGEAERYAAAKERLQGPGERRALAEKSVAELKVIARKYPAEAAVHHWLGVALRIAGKLDEARHEQDEALRLQPGCYEAHMELGRILRLEGSDEEAIPSFRTSLEICEDTGRGHIEIAITELRRGKYAEASSAVAEGLSAHPDNPNLNVLGSLLYGTRQAFAACPEPAVADTEHFHVASNTTKFQADRMGLQLERIHKLYEEALPDVKPDGRRIGVVLFDSAEQFKACGLPEGVAGVYLPDLQTLFLAWNPVEHDMLIVAYHEAFHAFLDYALQGAPHWLNEGLADYFGAFKWDDKSGQFLHRVNWWRLDTVQEMVRANVGTPLPQFLVAQSMYGKNAGLNYAQAWSLVWFMKKYKAGKYSMTLRFYFQALMRGETLAQAWEKSFGKLDMAEFTEEWKKFTLEAQKPIGAASVPGLHK